MLDNLRGRLHFIRPALRNKWVGKGDFYISPRWEWFYRIKAVICLLLDWDVRPGTSYYELPGIDLVYTAGGSFANPGEPTVHWAEALYVRVGIFKNWWCTIYQDSD